MLRAAPFLLALTGALCACPAATFAPRGGKCTARPSGCAFAIISGRGLQRYEVIGVIDIESFSARKLPNDEASFRAAVGAAVCRAGGDAVLAGINGDGRYTLATVVKWVDDPSRQPVCPLPNEDAGAPKAGIRDGGAADAGAPSAVGSAPEAGAGNDGSAAHAAHGPHPEAGAP